MKLYLSQSTSKWQWIVNMHLLTGCACFQETLASCSVSLQVTQWRRTWPALSLQGLCQNWEWGLLLFIRVPARSGPLLGKFFFMSVTVIELKEYDKLDNEVAETPQVLVPLCDLHGHNSEPLERLQFWQFFVGEGQRVCLGATIATRKALAALRVSIFNYVFDIGFFISIFHVSDFHKTANVFFFF